MSSSSNTKKNKSKKGKRNLSHYLPDLSHLNTTTSSLDNTISFEQSTNDMPETNPVNATMIAPEPNNDFITMCWNTMGKTICAGTKHDLNFWDMTSSGLKLTLKKSMQNFNIVKIKYISQYVIGGKAKDKVRFWDTRTSVCAKVFQLPPSSQEEYLLQVNKKEQIFTIGGKNVLKTYDIRNQKKQLTNITSQLPIYEVKWIEQNHNILVTAGGLGNKGNLCFYNQNAEKLKEFDVHGSPIVYFSVDELTNKLVTLGLENILQMFELPEMLCESVTDILDEEQTFGCELSYNAEYLTVLLKNELYLYRQKILNNPPTIYPIQKYSACSWHPTKNILAYIPQKSKSLSLLKLDKLME